MGKIPKTSHNFKYQAIKSINTIQKTPDIELLKKGEEADIKKVYLSYRPKFLQWIQNTYQVDFNDAEDIFQKSFLLLYQNVRMGKIEELQSSLETYFYGIAKNVLRDYKNQKYKRFFIFSENQNEDQSINLIEKTESEKHRSEIIRKLLTQIGEPCRSILKFYYFDKFSMESIANRLGYKNQSVITKKKYQCILKLRSLFQEQNINL